MSRMLSALRSLEAKVDSFEPPKLFVPFADEVNAAPALELADPEQVSECQATDSSLVASQEAANTATPSNAPTAVEEALVVAEALIAATQVTSPGNQSLSAESLGAFAAMVSATHSRSVPTRPAVTESVASRSLSPVDDVDPAAPAARKTAIEESPLTLLIRRELRDPRRAIQYRQAMGAVLAQYPAPASALLWLVGVDVGEHTVQVGGALAAMLAEHEERGVLLVDADLQTRNLSREFGVDDRPGLSEAIRATQTEMIEPYPTQLEGLRLLPAGRMTLRPADVAPQIGAVLTHYGAQERLTVILGGEADSALAQPLAAACDGVFLVVRLGQTPVDRANAVLERLRACRARIVGCLATNVAD